jgi:3-carboxy-cis,cis-muconate cycloisomerase
VRGLVSDEAWLGALLTVEVTLARVQADAGLIPAGAADAIEVACRPERYDTAELGAAAAESGNPVIPLVAALREAVGPAAAPYVHNGATSQDILDSAAMLLARRALGALLDDLAGTEAAAAGLARTHRDTVMAGRTLLQQAVPVTFGLLAAGWLSGLGSARARLAEVRRTRLAAQLGGPAGTLAGLGPDLPTRFAAALGLAAPVVPWHTDRTRIADLAGALGTVCGAIAKVARDVTLLAQAELGEVAEGRPGGSSSMAHKRNPVAAVSALAAAAQAPGLVATLLAAMPQELQRGAGGWHAEWRPLRELLTATGSAAAWLRACLEQLVVHPDRMRANLPPGPVDVGCAGELVDRALEAGLP